MHHEKIAKGFYMTSGGYTDEAKEIAKWHHLDHRGNAAHDVKTPFG
jgi:hypothetical protein